MNLRPSIPLLTHHSPVQATRRCLDYLRLLELHERPAARRKSATCKSRGNAAMLAGTSAQVLQSASLGAVELSTAWGRYRGATAEAAAAKALERAELACKPTGGAWRRAAEAVA
jgi:hypothetical protein